MAPPVCPAYAHEESLCFVITPFIELTGRSYCCVLFATYGGAVPALHSLIKNVLSSSAGKALEKLQQEESINQRGKSQLSSMEMIRIV